MQRPGTPDIRPETSAAKPAEPSCAVSTNSTPPLRMASMSGSTLPLGMPNPRSIPAAFKIATIKSALFIGICSDAVWMLDFCARLRAVLVLIGLECRQQHTTTKEHVGRKPKLLIAIISTLVCELDWRGN